MLRLLRYTTLMQLFLLLTGCVQLPEYARPHIVEIENRQEIQKQGFLYRALTRGDFQARSLPHNLVTHAPNIAAHACCRIRATEDTSYKITRGYLNRKIHYFGSINYVAFEAVMIPDCSWLNPEIAGEKLDYVLQHEQIHFALMELAARKLTREVREKAQDFMAIQSTYKAAREEISVKIKDMVRAASEAALRDHTAFDEDTSLYFDPEVQQRWLERVEERLSLTAPHPEED